MATKPISTPRMEIQDVSKLAEKIVQQLSVQQKTEDIGPGEERKTDLRLKKNLLVDDCDGKAKLLDKGKQKVDESAESEEKRHEGIKRMAFGALAGRSSKFNPEIKIEKRARSGPNWVLVNPTDIVCDFSSDEDD